MKADAKSTATLTARSGCGLGIKADHRLKTKRPDGSVGDSEMQQCFHKLKELVPTVPHDRKLSKVQLLQHVIDYILDLELTLDFQPADVAAASSQLLQVALQSERKPLTDSSSLINSSLAPQTDKTSLHTFPHVLC